MEYQYSAVLVLPADFKLAGDAFAEQMGWGPNCYSVPLSADGTAPATHYSCRAQAAQSFVDMFSDPPEEALPLIAALLPTDDRFRVSYDGAKHFSDVIASLGLSLVQYSQDTLP